MTAFHMVYFALFFVLYVAIHYKAGEKLNVYFWKNYCFSSDKMDWLTFGEKHKNVQYVNKTFVLIRESFLLFFKPLP